MSYTNEQLDAALACPMGRFGEDAGAYTVKDYLYSLLWALWDECEGFSGKRPFGNSCWEYDIYYALVVGGHIAGQVVTLTDDEIDICIDSFHSANLFVFSLIERVFTK